MVSWWQVLKPLWVSGISDIDIQDHSGILAGFVVLQRFVSFQRFCGVL